MSPLHGKCHIVHFIYTVFSLKLQEEAGLVGWRPHYSVWVALKFHSDGPTKG